MGAFATVFSGVFLVTVLASLHSASAITPQFRVLALGDSFTYGYDNYLAFVKAPRIPYTYTLQTCLQQRALARGQPLQVQVDNQGVQEAGVLNPVNLTQIVLNVVGNAVRQHVKYDWVILWTVGINDVNAIKPIPNPFPYAETLAKYKFLWELCLAQGWKVIVMTEVGIPFTGSTQYPLEVVRANLEHMVKLTVLSESKAKPASLRLFDLEANGFNPWKMTLAQQAAVFQPDGLHFTNSAYQRVGQLLCDQLNGPAASVPCELVPNATTTLAFYVTSAAPSWGACRDTLRLALQRVYAKYASHYPSSTVLSGPLGQARSPSGFTTWSFTTSITLIGADRCRPRADNIIRDLLAALAIPGFTLTAPKSPPAAARIRPPPPCTKAPLVLTYQFMITNQAPSWGVTRDLIVNSLKRVYALYRVPYQPATKLSGPLGQARSRSGTTTWTFTAALSVGENRRCQPQGDNMHRDLRIALAIPGFSLTPPKVPSPLPKPPCTKAPLVLTYRFTVTNKAPSWGVTRDLIVNSLKRVYALYRVPYQPATKLSGPLGQARSRSGTTTWTFTAALSVGENRRCQPQGDNMHRDLRIALAIPGFRM